MTQPLAALCSNKTPFKWDVAAQRAFDSVKLAIRNCIMLHHISYELPIVLRTDASLDGVGAILFNLDGTEEKPIWFLSKAFNQTERLWSTIEQEAFGVFWAIIALEHILLGHRFRVQTDHRNLVFVEKSQIPKIV